MVCLPVSIDKSACPVFIDGSINFDAALANSTILQDVFRDSMDMMPAAMDAIKNTVLNPEKV